MPAQARTSVSRLTPGARARQLLAARDRGYQLLVAAVVLAAWEYGGRRADDFVFAPPSSIVPAAREMIESGELPRALGDSAVALLIGFALAALAGTAVGYAMGWSRLVGRTLNPYVSALYVVPIASLVPAIIVWFGLDLTARVLVIFLFAVFEIVLSAQAGVRNVDPAFVDVARTFGAARLDVLRKVVLPASLPFVFVGLRMGASRALKGMVLAEMLFAVTGLGGLIVEHATAFRIDRVLVVVLTLALMGIVLGAAVQALERRVLRWRPELRGPVSSGHTEVA